MPDRARRLYQLGALVGLVLLVGLLSTAPARAAGATAAPARTGVTAAAPPVGGVDIDAVVEQLGDDHLAVVGSVPQSQAQWTAVVERARAHNLALSLVVLGTAPAGATPTEVANAILARVRGTVLVLGPATANGETVGLASSDVGQADIDTVRADVDGRAPTPATADEVVERLTSNGFPWLMVTVGGLIVLLCLGVAARLWRHHRRRVDRVEATAELTEWLRGRLSEIGERLTALRQSIADTQRDDLRTRLDGFSAEHAAVGESLDAGPLGRAQVDSVAGRLATLDDEVTALQSDVDAALAG